MQIANPIYDVVFKFLLEDSKVAKSFLKALLGFDIVELELMPQEMVINLPTVKPKNKKVKIEAHSLSLTVYRIDFAAKIKTATGELKQIVIELQKARLLNTIPRFREYLGAQYAKKDLFVTLQNIKNQSYKAGIPVFAIYFLGYTLDSYQDVPVLLVNSTVTDRYTNEVLSKSEPFITSLFHEGMIVNVPALQGKKRDAIEKLLSIFDQSNRKENFHILNVNENDFAEEHRAIIRRLQTAIESKDMLAKMNAEDEAFSDIEAAEKERDAALQKAREAELRLDDAKSKLDVVESKLDVAESKLDAAESKLDEAESKLDEAESKLDEAESKLDEERRQKISLIKLAASGGASIAMIAKMCHISEAEVLAILEKK